MHFQASLSITATAFLILGDVASAISISLPDIFRPVPILPICPVPPRPKVEFIDRKTLREKVRPRLPPLVNGVRQLRAYKPPNAELGIQPQLLTFKDPNGDRFLKIAPNSSQLWLRRQVRNDTRLTYPYTSFGKVFMQDGSRRVECTGSTVGENLLLTANHCIESRTDSWSIEWVPAFNAEDTRNPRPSGSAFVKRCIGIRDLIPGQPVLDGTDYAVCELDSAIGNKTGYVGFDSYEDNRYYTNRTWLSVGYPGTFHDGNVAILENEVKVKEVINGGEGGKLIISQQYVDKGWSGGPLFGWQGSSPILIGVVSSKVEVTDFGHIFEDYTYHAGGERLLDLIFYGRTEWNSRPQAS